MTRRGPDLRVGSWLGVGFGAAAVLLVAVVALAIVLLERISAAERRQMHFVAPRAEAASRLEKELLRVAIAGRAYAIAADERTLASFQEARERFRDASAAFEALPKEADGALAAELVPLARVYGEEADALVTRVASGAPQEELVATQAALGAHREAAVAKAHQYERLMAREVAEASAGIEEMRQRAVWTLALAAVLVLVLLGTTAVLVARGVRRPALRLAEAARRLGEGDYASAAALVAPPGGPEAYRNELAALGRTFGRMTIDLQEREVRIRAQADDLGRQNDELQAQREELQAQAEELQAQGEELQAQNEELHAQQEELRAQQDELRDHDDRLRASEERYRHLFQHLSEGFALHEMIWGPQGQAADYRFIEVNPAFERLTGLTREQAVGHTVRELLTGIEPEWIERYGEVARTRRPVRFEGWSGSLGRYFEVVAFSPEEGQFAALFFDVTERRAAEQALRDADRRKDEFLALLSHELRNPLAPIVAGLHVLEQPEAGGAAAHRAQAVIRRQVGHLVRLVDDLLDVTRVTRGKVHLRRTRVDLGAVVAQTAEDNAAVFADRGVALDVAAAPRPLRVDADAARVSQVLGNLLQNAAKFTPRGGRVSIAVAEESGRAVVRVRDTGVGIPGDVLPRLFQPFTQAESSLARTRGGLGLGLALVKGLVELHGGNVRAESDGEGKGAQFTVELPLEGVVTAAVVPALAPTGPRRRVLVVEDNEDAAETLADVLRLGGHEVEVARDGTEGLRRAAEWRPEAVLCDIGLPGIDGYEVARRLRAESAGKRTLLVALTGYALPEDLRRAREAGFDAHLAKPARLEEIEAILTRAERPRIDGV
jgi:PAS domain S-box-containing protein